MLSAPFECNDSRLIFKRKRVSLAMKCGPLSVRVSVKWIKREMLRKLISLPQTSNCNFIPSDEKGSKRSAAFTLPNRPRNYHIMTNFSKHRTFSQTCSSFWEVLCQVKLFNSTETAVGISLKAKVSVTVVSGRETGSISILSLRHRNPLFIRSGRALGTKKYSFFAPRFLAQFQRR